MYQLREFDPAIPLNERIEAVVAAPDIVGSVSSETKKMIYELVVKYALQYTKAKNIAELKALAWILKKVHAFIQDANTKAGKKGGGTISNDRAGRILERLDGFIDVTCKQHKVGEHLFRDIESQSLSHSPGYAVCMLLDLRATATIAGQIIFEQPVSPDVATEESTGENFGMVVDLGSGSAILGLAGIINCARRGCNAALLGYEQSPYDTSRSNQVLNTLGKKVGAHSFSHIIDSTDITENAPFQEIRETAADYPLQVWISETFGGVTPALRVGETVEWTEPTLAFNSPKAHRHSDPLPIVLQQQIAHDPDFLNNVRKGKFVMFPNVTNGSAIFGQGEHNKLQLNVYGPEMRLLTEIGKEFSDFEDFGTSSRW